MYRFISVMNPHHIDLDLSNSTDTLCNILDCKQNSKQLFDFFKVILADLRNTAFWSLVCLKSDSIAFLSLEIHTFSSKNLYSMSWKCWQALSDDPSEVLLVLQSKVVVH